ncbi:rhodanese-like domain-containing protein [Desertibaculum subflavum]|uniref:rhodanese-like domain-containing protein n=1 Tax=Desertibaculum subflavum TaxID=2268458 RepID=UPI000E6637E8
MSSPPNAGYAGDVGVADAMKALTDEPKAVLVDVRSQPEWTFVGLPDLNAIGKRPLCIEWQVFPGMAANSNFLSQLADAVPERDAPVYFLCRSGARSRAAAIAATTAGFARAYNIAGGFEGDLDDRGHRGSRTGWKAAGLPWRQS